MRESITQHPVYYVVYWGFTLVGLVYLFIYQLPWQRCASVRPGRWRFYIDEITKVPPSKHQILKKKKKIVYYTMEKKKKKVASIFTVLAKDKF